MVKVTTADLAAQSNQYEDLKLPEDVARKIHLLKLSVDIPAPRDPARRNCRKLVFARQRLRKREVVSRRRARKCLTIDEVENIMSTSRDPNELERAWKGWHAMRLRCANAIRAHGRARE